MALDGEASFDSYAQQAPAERYVLRLYVAGMTSRSLRAVENVRKICKRRLAGRYELQIVDLYQQPALAREEQVVAAPTLIKRLPLPLRRLVGDMTDERRVLGGLDLTSVNGESPGSARA